MTRFRKMSADTMVAPRRGEPPAAPDGYIRDEGDPFVFHVIMPRCPYREEKIVKTSCCESHRLWCNKLMIPIKRINCVEMTCANIDNDNIQ